MKENLQGYYPNLVINIEVHDSTTSKTYQNRFINTIKLKYYLLSNAQTDRSVISQLLYNMKLNTNELNRLPFIDAAISTYSLPNFTLPLETHQGASDFYQATGLYTDLSNPACVMINGRCDMRQLTEHHLGGTVGSPHTPPP